MTQDIKGIENTNVWEQTSQNDLDYFVIFSWEDLNGITQFYMYFNIHEATNQSACQCSGGPFLIICFKYKIHVIWKSSLVFSQYFPEAVFPDSVPSRAAHSESGKRFLLSLPIFFCAFSCVRLCFCCMTCMNCHLFAASCESRCSNEFHRSVEKVSFYQRDENVSRLFPEFLL